MDIDPGIEYWTNELAIQGINSCGQMYRDNNIDLPCYICHVVDECLSDLFIFEIDPNPQELLKDIPYQAIQMYLEHLQKERFLYRFPSDARFKNWDGRPLKEVIDEKIEVLERFIEEMNNKEPTTD